MTGAIESDADYVLALIDTTFEQVPEVKAHHERMRAIASRLRGAAVEAAKPAPEAVEPLRALPDPGSPEASAMLDSVLAEYGWPSNKRNAARAGWVAAMRWLKTSAALSHSAPETAPVEAK